MNTFISKQPNPHLWMFCVPVKGGEDTETPLPPPTCQLVRLYHVYLIKSVRAQRSSACSHWLRCPDVPNKSALLVLEEIVEQSKLLQSKKCRWFIAATPQKQLSWFYLIHVSFKFHFIFGLHVSVFSMKLQHGFAFYECDVYLILMALIKLD